MKKIKAWWLRVSVAMMIFFQTATMGVAEALTTGITIDDSGNVSANFPDLSGGNDVSGAMNGALDKYKTIAMAIFAFCTVTAFLMMIIQFTKLAAAGDNERERKKAIMGILTCGVAIMLLGGITVVIAFFWNSLTAPTTPP